MDTQRTISKVISISIEALSLMYLNQLRKLTSIDSKAINGLLLTDKTTMLKYHLSVVLSNLSCFVLIDQSTFVYSLVLIDRLVKKKLITLDTLYTSLIGVLLISLKVHQDLYRPNMFSKISGIPIDNLEMIEAEILEKLDYNLFILKDVYELYSLSLKKLDI